MGVSAKGEKYRCEICGNEVIVEKVGEELFIVVEKRWFFSKRNKIICRTLSELPLPVRLTHSEEGAFFE